MLLRIWRKIAGRCLLCGGALKESWSCNIGGHDGLQSMYECADCGELERALF